MFLINENLKIIQKDYQASDILIQLIVYGLKNLDLQECYDIKTIGAWLKLLLCLYPKHSPKQLGQLIAQVSLIIPDTKS